MLKFFKMYLLVGAALGVILFLVSIGVNLYLQSQSVQQRIIETASRAVRRQVYIQNAFYTPWGGVTLNKVVLTNREKEEGYAPPLLEIPKIRLRISWMPLLLQREIRISSVKIEDPTITLTQNAEGKLLLQTSPEGKEPIAETQAVAPVALEESTLSSVSEPILSKSARVGSFSPVLPKISISGGKFYLLSPQGVSVVSAEDISTKLTPRADGYFTGPMACTRIVLGRTLFFQHLRTQLTCNINSLEAHSLVASLANGKILGEFRCKFGKRPAFELKAKVADASLQTLLTESGYNAGGSSGTLQGDLWVFSQGDKLEPYGNGSLELVQGQLEPTDFLRQLGRILQIQELELLRLKKALASFQIKDDRVIFENIFLESENLILKGAGPVKFNGRLDIAAQLLFNDRLYAQYQSLIGKQLIPSSIEGYHEVAFRVSGKTARPHADLLDKLTGLQIQGSIGGLLQQLIQWPHSTTGPASSQSR